MIGTDATSSAEGGAGTEVRADAAVASEEWNEVFCVSIAGTVFGIDDSGKIESVAAVNSGLISSTDDASGEQCGTKISTRRPLDSKLCIAKPLKVIKI